MSKSKKCKIYFFEWNLRGEHYNIPTLALSQQINNNQNTSIIFEEKLKLIFHHCFH